MGGIFGVTLMLWICIQFYMFPLNFMSTAFFVIGFCQAATGYAAGVFYRQEQFVVWESDYPNIGTNPKRLVVYFSRMGYVKKQAMEEADRTTFWYITRTAAMRMPRRRWMRCLG